MSLSRHMKLDRLTLARKVERLEKQLAEAKEDNDLLTTTVGHDMKVMEQIAKARANSLANAKAEGRREGLEEARKLCKRKQAQQNTCLALGARNHDTGVRLIELEDELRCLAAQDQDEQDRKEKDQ